MPVPTTDSLVTTVQNLSGVESSFGYLPPHGRRLAPNETFSVFGNIVDRIAQKGERSIRAFEGDLESGAIGIVSTPSPVFNQGGLPKIIQDSSGTLGTADPSWVA